MISSHRYWSHLIESHPTLAQDALKHAQIDGNGPFYVGEVPKEKVLYAATQVKGDSQLGRKWNLRQYIDGRLSQYDAHLFWKIDRKGPQLLRLDIWPAGSEPQQRITMQEAIHRFPRLRWGCC